MSEVVGKVLKSHGKKGDLGNFCWTKFLKRKKEGGKTVSGLVVSLIC